jgi:hypothetical protein
MLDETPALPAAFALLLLSLLLLLLLEEWLLLLFWLISGATIPVWAMVCTHWDTGSASAMRSVPVVFIGEEGGLVSVRA